jgi:hypothetical protein
VNGTTYWDRVDLADTVDAALCDFPEELAKGLGTVWSIAAYFLLMMVYSQLTFSEEI